MPPRPRVLRATFCLAALLAGALPLPAPAQTGNYENAYLVAANFENAGLQNADFRNAKLQRADLQGADLRGANMRGANLRGANLQSANLQGVNLQQANLAGADLQSANLQNANLADTNLAGTNLFNANLLGAIRAVNHVAAAPATPAPLPVPKAVPLPAITPAQSPLPVAVRSVPTTTPSPSPSPSPSPAPGPAVIHLSAGRVEFFYDRFLVEADGNVRVRTSNGVTMTGDTFSMDLKLNRFLLAGHVHMQNPSGSQDGAALADFLEFDRIYFVPLTRESQTASGIPDRWTFVGNDFANPAKGREMPGDTFYFPDLGDAKPYLTGTSAVIGSHSFVRFGGGQFDVGEGLGLYVPVPSYYVNFSADQHLGDNSLAGANYDATWEFAGNANAISALHFRYDTVNKTYMAFEQHLSGKKAYAVFSLNPMTRPSKFWSLLLSDRPSDRTQIRSFTQLHTFQYGLKSPLESQQVTTIQATQALRGSFLQANYQFENFSLLPLGCYPRTPGNFVDHCTVPDHPSSLQLIGQTFDQPLTHYFQGARVYGHINYGFGFQHNSLGLQTVGGVNYTTIWQHQLGFGVFMPDLKFGPDLNIPTKYYAINASFEKQRQWNSAPHYIDTTQSKISLSKTLDNHVLAFLDYSVQNVGDVYSGSLSSTVYPGFTPIVNGISYPGYQAFHGVATFRTLSLGLNYTNGGNVAFNLLVRKHTDFPAPIPFFFQFAQPDVLGNFAVQNFLGQPPYDATADLRLRINPHMSIDIQRSYYFNYSNLRWSPNFVFQVLQ